MKTIRHIANHKLKLFVPLGIQRFALHRGSFDDACRDAIIRFEGGLHFLSSCAWFASEGATEALKHTAMLVGIGCCGHRIVVLNWVVILTRKCSLWGKDVG